MQINTDGLVIMEKSVGENDRLITVLTREEGVLRAFARQAKLLNSRRHAATQLLSYSQFQIYKGKDKYIINDAQPEHVFFGLRSDIERLSLAQYFCELACRLAPEGMPAGDFLRLVLNGLHFLEKGSRSPFLVKAAVEMRMLSFAGYMPDLIGCSKCGCYESKVLYFLPKRGMITCENCYHETGEVAIPLQSGVMTALRHTIYADFEKLFSFQLPEEGLRRLAEAAESYVGAVLECRLATLDFYHSLIPAQQVVPK